VYRVVIHGVSTRAEAVRLLALVREHELLNPSAIDLGMDATIEPDDAETASRPGGAATQWVSLRKDTLTGPRVHR
jgi:hypothetical protein